MPSTITVNQCKLESFGAPATDGSKMVRPGSLTLQGNSGSWTTIAADQYLVGLQTGLVRQSTLDSTGAAVDWSSYTSFRATYTVLNAGTETTYTNELVTGSTANDGLFVLTETAAFPVGADGELIADFLRWLAVNGPIYATQGYIAGVLKVIGSIIAGGGAVTIDANGIQITTGAAAPNYVRVMSDADNWDAVIGAGHLAQVPEVAEGFFAASAPVSSGHTIISHLMASTIDQAVLNTVTFTAWRAQMTEGATDGAAQLAGILNGQLALLFDKDACNIYAPLDMESHKITSLADGTAATDAATVGQLPTGIKNARITSDYTSEDVALSDVTGLSFTIGASEVWEFDFYLACYQSGTGGIKVAVNGPSGATIAIRETGNTADVNTFLFNRHTGLNTAGATFITASGFDGQVYVHGIITNSTNAGTVQLRGRRGTANGTARIYANSYLVASKLA